MPGSWPYLREAVKTYLCNKFPPESRILDIGAGEGTYYNLLSDYFTRFDAVEIWEPYIHEYGLYEKYDNVYNENIMDMEIDEYDIIIIGDTLEHISREDGIKLIPYLANRCKELVVVIPFNLPQGEVFGNKYEIHLQPDLSHEIMALYYPCLTMLSVDGKLCDVRIDAGDQVYYLCAYIKR